MEPQNGPGRHERVRENALFAALVGKNGQFTRVFSRFCGHDRQFTRVFSMFRGHDRRFEITIEGSGQFLT